MPIPEGAIPISQFIPDRASMPANADGIPAGAIPVDQFVNDEDKYGSVGQQALTVAEGLGHGFAGPVATGAEATLSKLGIPGLSPKEQALRAEANPVEHYGSEIAGFGAGALTGTGEAAVLGDIGKAAVGAAPVVSKIAQTGIKVGAEMAALQAGDEVSKAINQDPGFSLGSAAINVGLSGILGGAGGAVLGSVSPFFKKAANKLGVSRLASDFMGESAFLRDKNLPQDAAKEVSERISQTEEMLSQAGNLKGEAIAKALPETTPESLAKIEGHVQSIAEEGAKKIEQASKNTYLKGVVGKMTQDLADFTEAIANPNASSLDKWDALNEYKSATQGHANYNLLTAGAEDKAVSKWIKPFAASLRESLEDTKVWGDAGGVQKNVNKALSGLYDAQKDFLSKVTSPEMGERIANPDKIQSIISQAQKGRGALKVNAINNYLEATQKVADAINAAHIENGLEAPLSSQLNPTPILNHTLNTPMTPGRALGQWAYAKGAQTLANATGEAGASTIGGIAGSLIGHPLAGAWAGDKILAPTFSVLAKPFAETAVNSEAMRASVDYIANAVKGDMALNKAVKDVFTTAEVVPKFLFPSTTSIESLQKSLKAADNQDHMLGVGGNIGHYLPTHGAAIGAMAASSVNYLDNLKPKSVPAGPFDSEPPIDKAAQAGYERALQIAQQPLMALKHVKEGTLIPQDVQTMQAIYPGLHAAMISKINTELINQKSEGKHIPYSQRVALSLFTGSNLDSTMSPMSMQSVIQSGAQQQAQRQDAGNKKASGTELKAIDKVNDLYATPLQRRQIDKKR